MTIKYPYILQQSFFSMLISLNKVQEGPQKSLDELDSYLILHGVKATSSSSRTDFDLVSTTRRYSEVQLEQFACGFSTVVSTLTLRTHRGLLCNSGRSGNEIGSCRQRHHALFHRSLSVQLAFMIV